jgi:hypothetical protein
VNYKDLVQKAKDDGMAVDANSFAEWLVDDQEYFGRLDEGSDLESAWQQAMDWWNHAHEDQP